MYGAGLSCAVCMLLIEWVIEQGTDYVLVWQVATWWALAELAGVVLAGSDLPMLAIEAGMAQVGVQANAVQASGSQSHVAWGVDNPYAQHMGYPSVDQLAFVDMMDGGPVVLGCVVVVGHW